MPETQSQAQAQAQAESRPVRRPRRYIDWRQAACLLAAGQAAAVAAAAIGVSEDRLMRHLETSPHFVRLILRAGDGRRRLARTLQEGRETGDAAGISADSARYASIRPANRNDAERMPTNADEPGRSGTDANERQ